MKKVVNTVFTSIILIFLSFLVPKVSLASSLWFSPTSGTFSKDSTLNLKIGIDTKGEAINAVQANVLYPADKLQFLSASTSGSALTIIAEKSGGGGVIRIAGGTLPPGFSGSKLIASLSFKVMSDSGTGSLNFAGDSSALRISDNSESLSSKGSATLSFSTTSSLAPSPSTVSENLIISDVSVNDIGKKTATISWKTNRKAASSVDFGPTSVYAFNLTSPDLVLDHSIKIDESYLVAGTTYYFKVRSLDKNKVEASSDESQFSTKGYSLVVKVKDPKGNPIKDAFVRLFSTPKEGETDANGEITFEDVSPGNHGVIVTSKGSTITKQVDVKDEDTPQNFEAQFSSSDIKRPISHVIIYVILVIVGVSFVASIILFYLKIKKKKDLGNIHNVNLMNEPPKENPPTPTV